ETGTGTENGNGTGNGTEDDNNITTSATYYWTGAVSSDWNNAGNWATSAPSNSIARSMMDVTPDANGNVVIPKLTSGSYPVLTDAKTIANLYIAPGAAIGNQWRLTVTGKVYTDVEIPSNQWVRMCMPLRDTYSGDMFTELQGGRAIPADSTFTPAYYEPTPGNTGNNRVFPYAIYQRVFSDAATHQLSDVQGDNVVEQLNTAWSRPYNALAERYQVGEGFDLWSPSTNATSTFRFPSATNTYYYWYNNGQPSQLSETVNHTASGTMAYNQDVLDVTITRAARASDAGVPMYAVGNPAFAHLDIAKFIRVNSYGANHSGNAAVVGNITPYLYFYNENGTLNSGEAGETIYYLDQDKNLYTVNAAVDNSNMPTGTNTSASAAYVAPTRGFRVMAGQAEVSSVEPKLIGQYTNATYQMAPVPYYTSTDQGGTSGVNKCGYGRSLWSTTPTDANDGVGVASLVFSATSYPDTIELQNFAGMAVAKAAIDPINQTLTIPGNSNVAFYNHSTWSSGGSTTGFTNAFIYGCTDGKNLEYSYQNQNSHSIGYANNVSPTQDVIIDYTISGTTVTLSLRNAFAIYDASQPTRYTSASGSSISSSEYYNSFDCFESMTASLNFSTNEAAYANMNVFGTYRYQITEDANKMSMPNSDNIVTGNYVDFQILPIEGNYNIVRVRGLYHYAGSSSLVDAIATVTPQDANGQSTINIPAAQLVYNEGDMSSNAFFIYGFNTGRDSLTFTFNYNNGGSYLTLPTNTYIQISQQTSNPNKDANSPGYRGGAYSTSVTSGDTTSITNPTTFAAGTYLMSYNNTYVGYDGTNVVNTTTQPSLTNKDYSFTFAQTGNYYTIQNGNGKYLNVSTNGTLSWDDTGTANWTVTYQNSTLYLYYRSGNGWNRTYYYLQYDNDNGNLSIVNNGKSTSTSYPWKIYAEVTTGGTTTTLTCIPKVADWSGASSGTSGSTITWSVGTNYEAINLKYTSAMFNANPGSSSTNAPAAAPRRTAAQGSTMATVMLESNGHSVNTLITKRANGSNGYNVFEDAVLVDVNDNNLMLATMAGTHAVAVNTLGDTTAVRLLLHNVNGTITLTFDNMAALGNNVRLYDAETGTATPLNPQTATITLNTTVNDSPLRYSLVWDTPTGIDDIELTDDNVWFQAYSAAKGTIKVVSNDNLTSVRLFDATGKLVASRINNGNETMFEYLLSGVYMVEASNGKEVKTIKVSVK
ncbi:MAG: T9SS type A sorting domain-containing protein, partial [Bacteroidales bacterium]|nr:T9SS type A sorting domain-containing protein [Bacteroidales bacterium]